MTVVIQGIVRSFDLMIGRCPFLLSRRHMDEYYGMCIDTGIWIHRWCCNQKSKCEKGWYILRMFNKGGMKFIGWLLKQWKSLGTFGQWNRWRTCIAKRPWKKLLQIGSLPMQSLQTLSELLLTDNLTVRYGIIWNYYIYIVFYLLQMPFAKNSPKLIAQLVQYLSIRIAWIISTKCFSCVMIFNE